MTTRALSVGSTSTKQDYSEGVERMKLTQEQIENIQIDYGIVFMNYGETDEKQLGPTRGGGEFVATATIRDIEFDGSKGKTKGMQVVDDITAQLNVTQLNTSMDTLKMALPFAKYDDVTGKLSVGSRSEERRVGKECRSREAA